MVQKSTLLTPVDKTGVLKVNMFHVYGSSKKKVAKIGNFIKISVRETLPETKLPLKKKIRSIFIRSKYRYLKFDGSVLYSDLNACVLLKKRLTPVGKELHGPIYRTINRRKFLNSFSGIL